MSNNSIIIPDDLNAQIDARVAVWTRLDTSSQQAVELAGMASQAQSGVVTVSPITTLITEGTPSLEIEVALSKAKVELDNIARMKNEIKARETEIAQLMSRRKTLIISAVIAGGLAIFAILAALPK